MPPGFGTFKSNKTMRSSAARNIDPVSSREKLQNDNASQQGNAHLQKKVLLSEEPAEIVREHFFSPEIIRFLERTTLGTEETLYRNEAIRERVKQIHDPVIAILSVHGEMAAMVVIERRKVISNGFECKAYYFRYLASDVTFRNRRYVGKYGRKLMQLIVEAEQDKAVFYSYVESKNFRSINFQKKIGFEERSEIRALGFSRFKPKMHEHVRFAGSEDRDIIVKQVKKHHQEYALLHFSHLLRDDNYLVLQEDGEIVAGLQIHEASWVVERIPDKLGSLAMKILPYIPYLRKVFNPKKFQFLSFEGCFYEKGHPEQIIQLIESALSIKALNSAIIWMDSKIDLYQELQNARLGLLNYFVQSTRAECLLISKNLNAVEESSVYSGPIYLSTFDFI